MSADDVAVRAGRLAGLARLGVLALDDVAITVRDAGPLEGRRAARCGSGFAC